MILKDLETIKSQTGQINNRLNTNQTVELNESDKVKDLERALSLESSKVKVLDEELRAKEEHIEELVRNKTAGKEELEELKVIRIYLFLLFRPLKSTNIKQLSIMAPIYITLLTTTSFEA